MTQNSTSTRKPRFWKSYAGKDGEWWKAMKSKSIMTLGSTTKAKNDFNTLPTDRDEFLREIKTVPGVGSKLADAAWNLVYEIATNDFILAMKGYNCYGYGQVVGEYRNTPNGAPFDHTRPVLWREMILKGDDFPADVWRSYEWQDIYRGMTPSEITEEEFDRTLEAAGLTREELMLTGETAPSLLGRSSDLNVILAHLAASGLRYTESQIAAFYTALQTKGFVVLSGISGTGKSKIATGFVEMLPDTLIEAPTLGASESDEEPITFQVRPYMQSRHQIRFAKRYLERFPLFTEFQGATVPVAIGDVSGTGNLRFEFLGGRPGVSLWMHQELFEAMEAWTVDDSIIVDLDFDDKNENVVGIRILKQDLASVSPRQYIISSNHLFLSVRPDWRDSTSLLGYYNPLTQTYEWTDFLKFIIQAGQNYKGPPEERIAWFVLLDEMNLAHVEYYFADLLSVIESGRDAEGWTSEPLRLTYPDTLDDEVPPRELYLPPNLYIIGTVNMDETTHAFSPKVLDRAFTIELTDVNFRDYPPAVDVLGGEGLDDGTKAAMLAAFSRDGAFARIDKEEIGAFIGSHSEVRDNLQALNDVLRPFRMHFGYRVFDEVTQYLANNDINGMATFEEAFDQAVFMKVLPKFSGSRARLQSPLHGVLAWAVDPLRTSRDDVENATKRLLLYERGEAPEAWEVRPVFPRVAERVRDMLVALERDGFVSFG